jgi:tRNA (mo5U34)-methyltransferase
MTEPQPTGAPPRPGRVGETYDRPLDWYHTFDLPNGVTTAGMFDHRQFVTHLPFPASMTGMRCLDVAASDGFFGFEMARRGAKVVSLDLPDHADQDYWGAPKDRGRAIPIGRANECFNIVREATGLEVERVDGSLYDVESLGLGQFDLVFVGNILLHLEDPIKALHTLRSVTGGQLLSVEPISMPLTLLRPLTPCAQFSLGDENTFWTGNLRGHRALVRAGGYDITSAGRPLLQPMGKLYPARPSRNLPRSWREVVYWSVTRPFGKATSWVLATPTP